LRILENPVARVNTSPIEFLDWMRKNRALFMATLPGGKSIP
jgi:hypothetical protein